MTDPEPGGPVTEADVSTVEAGAPRADGEAAAADVDALVAAIAPRARPPAVRRRDVVLVTGPWLAGVSGVVAALRDRLPDRRFVETVDLTAGEVPEAVVFVVSAAAALTGSDCTLLDAAAAHTDVVVGVVSKIDVYRHWPEMQAVARAVLGEHAPRYRDVPWIGVAATPDTGEPLIDDLVAELHAQLGDTADVENPSVQRRNRLRAWEFRLQELIGRYDREVAAARRRGRVTQLQEQRDTALRQRRLAKSERTIALRSQISQARLQLAYFARNRCSSVRGELAEDAAEMTRARLPEFEPYVRERVEQVLAEVDEGAAEHLADMANELELPLDQPVGDVPTIDVGEPGLKSRKLETRLMMLLGAGFGLGVALTLSRLLIDLTPGLTVVGAVACVAVGLAVTVWVVTTRGLLHDRAVLDRWVTDVISTLKSTAEELVALRVLSAETALSAAVAEHNELESAEVTAQVGALDRELREHAVAVARAEAVRDREVPALQRALTAVRVELDDPDCEVG